MGERRLGRGIGGHQYLDRASGEGRALGYLQFPVLVYRPA
jgi:hypothetical protein